MKVFLSHSSTQKPFVKSVKDKFPPWLVPWLDDDHLLLGDDLTESLQKAILTECNFLIVFISDDAAESEWVRKEVTWAKHRQDELSRVFVLPILMDCSSQRLADLGLEGKKAITTTGNGRNAKDVARQLVDQISAHCAQLLPDYTSVEAEKRRRLKTYLLAAYIALLVAAAAGGSKVMSWGYPAAGVTVVSFAFTFLITDCVNQVFGQKEAQGFIAPGFLALLLATGFMLAFVHLPYDSQLFPQSFRAVEVFRDAYDSVLVPPMRFFFAGLVAYLIGQLCNIWIFDKIREKTTFHQRGRRNVIATLLSQLVDTLIFVPGAFLGSFLGFSGYPIAIVQRIFVGQFIVKAFVAIFVSYPAFLYLTKVFREGELKPPIS